VLTSAPVAASQIASARKVWLTMCFPSEEKVTELTSPVFPASVPTCQPK